MKILLINHFPLEGSGSGVYTINIAKSLVKEGHKVKVIMPETTTSYKRYDGITLHPVYFLNDEIIDDQLPFNFPCFTTHPRSINNFFDLDDGQLELYINKFKQTIEFEINNFKPDIIHVQHIWILADIASKYEIPTIITAHGTDLIGYQKSPRFHKFSEDAVSRCNKIITISEDNRNSVLNFFPLAKGKISLMKNGYDEDVFYVENLNKKEVLKSLGILKEYEQIVCYVGKMTEIKGVDILLQATKIYENDKILTILAGNGELFEVLREMANDLDLKNTVFVGNQDHDTLRKLYNIADVSIVPSRFEAFGLVAIEALACGTPVICSDRGGLPGIINKDIGIVVPAEESSMLANTIQEVLNNSIRFDGDFIASYTYQNYSQSSLIDKLIDLYKDVYKGK